MAAMPFAIAAVVAVLLMGMEVWIRISGVLSGELPPGDAIINAALTALPLLGAALVLTAIAIKIDPSLEPGYVDPKVGIERVTARPDPDDEPSRWNPFG